MAKKHDTLTSSALFLPALNVQIKKRKELMQHLVMRFHYFIELHNLYSVFYNVWIL